jgi:hypothetical protein
MWMKSRLQAIVPHQPSQQRQEMRKTWMMPCSQQGHTRLSNSTTRNARFLRLASTLSKLVTQPTRLQGPRGQAH